MTNYEFFYEGTPYSLEPGYGGFIGYRLSAGRVGVPTGIQTANQIQEVTNLLNQGIKMIELQPLSPEVFEQIPKQHFEAIKQQTKLTGAETSVHAPIVEPSGFTKEGWSNLNRENAERQLKSVVEKSHQLNPKGNVSVTIHASAIPGTEWTPGKEEKREPRYKEVEIIGVNQETGQMAPFKEEEVYYPEKEKKEIKTPRRRIKMYNDTQWSNGLANLSFYKKQADEMLSEAALVLGPDYDKIIQGKEEKLTPEQARAISQIKKAGIMLDHVQAQFITIYDNAKKYTDLKEIKDEGRKRAVIERFQDVGEQWSEAAKKFPDPFSTSELLDNSIHSMDAIGKLGGIPKIMVPIEEFAQDKSSTTFANVAFEAYDKFKDNAPMINIENLHPGMAFSRSEQLKKLVDESRKKFVKKAIKKGYSKSEAREAAKKVIGVTWDVGHINMLRKAGFKEKDILKETQEIAKYVKHVHLTDNFGYSDSHLPPGMGNVPTKEILKRLEKAGYFERAGKTIVEAGSFVQHFKRSPHPYVLEALGSPIYAMDMAPYWNQAIGFQQGYFAGYGTFLPEQHFSMYGSGFSGLPTELGGQIPGKQTRFGGTPM